MERELWKVIYVLTKKLDSPGGKCSVPSPTDSCFARHANWRDI